MNISTADAQGLYTKTLIDVYKSRPKPSNFLRNFFPTVVTPSLEVSIEVQRGFEKIAVDVVRGTGGNRNQTTRSSEKIIVPPYYREFLDMTGLQFYDRLYGATEINDSVFAAYINDLADQVVGMQEKIERSYELQCAQVLLSGVVSLKAATSIDFKRKAGSLVDLGAGNYFATGTVDPFATFEAGCNFLRQIGKSGDGVFNAIVGSQVLSDLLGNPLFQKRQNYFNMALDAVVGPARDLNTGATYHGNITAGAYKVQLWAYPQFYDDSTNTSTPYIDPKKVIMFPSNPRFKMAFGAVPQLIKANTAPKIGAFVFGDYIDERMKNHIFDVESAGIAVPVAIDQIYTFKAVA